MLVRPGRFWAPALLLSLCAFLGSPASAQAASGLYLRFGGGLAQWSGRELVTREQAVPGDLPVRGPECCPSGTLGVQARFGIALFESIAPELVGVASGWDFDGETSGSAFVGGGLRLFPLGLLEQLSLLNLDGVPFDLSLGAGFGYALTGSDAFAYEGTAFGADISAEWMVASFFSVGVSVDFWFPNYDAFALTSYSGNRGRCLDANAAQILDPASPRDSIVDRGDAGVQCPRTGRGPDTTVVSPQLIMAFHFDVI